MDHFDIEDLFSHDVLLCLQFVTNNTITEIGGKWEMLYTCVEGWGKYPQDMNKIKASPIKALFLRYSGYLTPL